jgi:histidinol-phosphatase (PHP family)
VLAGLSTGDFLYLAHPDIAGFRFSKETCDREYRRLCEGAKRMGVPLEINFLGLRTNRQYPSEDFFKIAAEVGNDVIFGADAHEAVHVFDAESEKTAKSWVEKYGLHLVEDCFLKQNW